MLTAMLPAATAPIRHLPAAPIVSQQSSAPRTWVWSRSERATAVVLGLLCMRSHTRPEQMPYGRRQKMLNRPSYQRPTGQSKSVFFLNSPTRPASSPGRSKTASALRAKIGSLQRSKAVVDAVKSANAKGQLEASVWGAAVQRCGDRGWWQGLTQLCQLQQERLVLFPCERNILLTALANSLKCKKKHHNVPEHVPIALEMAKAYWREVGLDKDIANFNIGASSALKLATCLDCEAAWHWGLEVWSESSQDIFRKKRDHISFSAYIYFLEHYQLCEVVDTLLESREDAISEAVNVVLLSSLLNSMASRGAWERADRVWDLLMSKGVEPNIIAYRTLAKVHLLAGHPVRVLKIFESLSSSGTDLTEDHRNAHAYAQASLVVCHSSLDLASMMHLEEFLALTLDKGQTGPKQIRTDLLKMRRVLQTLVSKPRAVYLRDVLIKWNARKQSVMAEWENFPGGSSYLEDQPPLKN